MTDLWIASGNAKKRAELVRLIEPLGYSVRTLDETDPIEFVEDAPTFAGNAAIKATTLARAVGGFALGDDSGLCVDAMDGRPGVHSARWAGPDATDADRIAKLLETLGPGGDRSARFVCHLCLANGSGEVLATFERDCTGQILETPQGVGGFGYDPVFRPDDFADHAPSFAELTAEQKDSVSHRGRALRDLIQWLETNPLTT